MAGTVTVTENVHGSVKKITFAWTSSAGGAADGSSSTPLNGKVIRLTTVPAGGGSAPTDNYDVVLNDADGHDVLAGAGADRDTANTEHVAEASLGVVANSVLTLGVTNAGATKQGTVIVWVR